ncbi:hypothetical protein PAPYR_13323 [Paratrimastix pyriformis]|uniref:Transmembrane protein n=1 Tax=Paratrimastix pyriformis TaxID=342808 RepID=A0ABQ8U0E0_9EUKA|nr:hypothetical protein PAPYR_13323 [Paratrimastix pyriformis]
MPCTTYHAGTGLRYRNYDAHWVQVRLAVCLCVWCGKIVSICVNQYASINMCQSICVNQYVSINMCQSICVNQYVSINMCQSICVNQYVSINMCQSICVNQYVAHYTTDAHSGMLRYYVGLGNTRYDTDFRPYVDIGNVGCAIFSNNGYTGSVCQGGCAAVTLPTATANGMTLYARVRAQDRASNYIDGDAIPFMIDVTAPVVDHVWDGHNTTADETYSNVWQEISGRWTFSDPESTPDYLMSASQRNFLGCVILIFGVVCEFWWCVNFGAHRLFVSFLGGIYVIFGVFVNFGVCDFLGCEFYDPESTPDYLMSASPSFVCVIFGMSTPDYLMSAKPP